MNMEPQPDIVDEMQNLTIDNTIQSYVLKTKLLHLRAMTALRVFQSNLGTNRPTKVIGKSKRHFNKAKLRRHSHNDVSLSSTSTTCSNSNTTEKVPLV